MYESSGSQFFRTTTGIQLGSDAYVESRFVMTFLTILGVTEIRCSFRLVLEGKMGTPLLKALDISSATTQLASDLFKSVAILSDTTVRRSAVD